MSAINRLLILSDNGTTASVRIEGSGFGTSKGTGDSAEINGIILSSTTLWTDTIIEGTIASSTLAELEVPYATNAGALEGYTTGAVEGRIPVLGPNGKLADSMIPSLALVDTHEVASEAAMLALTAQQGDIAIRSDESKTYVLSVTPASTLANWKEIKSPTGAVSSVNGKTGVVTLTASDVGAAATNHSHEGGGANTITLPAGDAITAGDIVSIINDGGTIKGFNRAAIVQSIPAGTFRSSGVVASSLSSCKMSDSQVVIAFSDSANGNYGTAIIGTVSDTGITWGSASVFNSAVTNYPFIAKLSDTKVVIVFDGTSVGKAIVGTISGTSFTWDSASTYISAGTSSTVVTRLTDTTFAVTYNNASQSYYAYCVHGTLSGSTISWGNIVAMTSAGAYNLRSERLSDITFAVSYADGSNSNLKAVVCTVSGTSISVNSIASIVSEAVTAATMSVVDSTKLAFAYRKSGYYTDGYVKLAAISGTMITAGSEYSVASVDWTCMDIAVITSALMVISFKDASNNGYCTTIAASISGTVPSFGPKSVADTGSAGILATSITPMGSDSYVCVYVNSSNVGKSSSGSVSDAYNSTPTVVTGSESTFVSASLSSPVAVRLTDSLFSLTYYKASDYYMYTIIGSISNGVITWGTETLVSNVNSTNSFHACELTENSYIVAYAMGGYIKASVVTVSGTVPTIGTANTIANNSSGYMNCTALTSTKLVFGYANANNSRYGYFVAADVSGATITPGTARLFYGTATEWIYVARMSDSTFVSTFRSESGYNGEVMMGSVTGTTINLGSSVVYSATNTYYNQVVRMTDSQFVIFYRTYSSAYGKVIVGNVSGLTISMGTAVTVVSGDMSANDITRISDTSFMGTYLLGSAIYAFVGTISNSVITLGTVVTVKASTAAPSIALISSSMFISSDSTGAARLVTFGTYKAITPNIANKLYYNEVAGVATNTCAKNANVTIQLNGVVSNQVGLTPGLPYYLNSNFDIQTTPVALPGSVTKPSDTREIRVGRALTATSMLIGIDYI